MADTGPEPVLADDLVFLLGDGSDEFGDGELGRGSVESGETVGKLGEEVLHSDAMVDGVLDLGMIRVELGKCVSLKWVE